MASFLFSSFVLLFICCETFFAEVPNEITYSGRLREYGQPVNGTRTMIFRICNSAGGELWTSGAQTVTISSGVFSYRLTPTLDWREKDLYIETNVNGKNLSPREKITSQAFALHSRTAEDIEKSAGQNIHFAIGGTTIATINSDGNMKNFLPTGTILSYGGITAPTGYFLCNSQAVSRTTYSDLFAVIGISFGEGNGSTTFNVPDLRGRFLRGRDNGAGRDPDAASRTAMNTGGNTGDNVGSVQGDVFQGHLHSAGTYILAIQYGATPTTPAAWLNPNGGASSNEAVGGYSGSPYTDSTNGTPRTSSETRPINAYVNYIIKY